MLSRLSKGAESGEHVDKTGEVMEPPTAEPVAEVGGEVGAEASVEDMMKVDDESARCLHGQAHEEVTVEAGDQVHKEVDVHITTEAEFDEESEQQAPEDQSVACSDGVARYEAEEGNGKLQDGT